MLIEKDVNRKNEKNMFQVTMSKRQSYKDNLNTFERLTKIIWDVQSLI